MQPTNPFKGQQLARTPVHISSDTSPMVPPRELDMNESHGDLKSQLDHMQSSDSMRAAIASSPISSPVQSQADIAPTMLETFDAHHGPQHMAELMPSPGVLHSLPSQNRYAASWRRSGIDTRTKSRLCCRHSSMIIRLTLRG